jgi:SAM-dependent methyltransferase
MSFAKEKTEGPPRRLIDEICERYKVRKGFASLYAQKDICSVFPGIETLDEIFAKCRPIQKIWIEYALTTNQRGREVYDFISKQISINKRSKRYIDIGCGYGGFVIAFAEKGFDSYGIEIDDRLFELSQQNCSDHGIKEHVFHNDFLDIQLEKLGKFDVITCNEVIEHVQNPEEALRKLAKLLGDGGALFMEIPNRDALSFIEADGHFGLFAIVLLDRQNAAVYKKHATGVQDDYEHMGEYYPLGFYINRLEREGLRVKVYNRHTLGDLNDVPRLLAKATAKFSEWFETDQAKTTFFIAERLISGFLQYLERLSRDYARALYQGEMESFRTSYLETFWSIVATKE